MSSARFVCASDAVSCCVMGQRCSLVAELSTSSSFSATASGEVVTKDQLIAQVWHGAVVEENNIQVHVSALRKALDDGGGAQRYVRTVQGRGYRLVGARDRAHQAGSDSVPQMLPVPDKPSIAVLPFANLSNDPEQEYFADGVVEDITVGLSRMRSLS